jgi:hypothetical protein
VIRFIYQANRLKTKKGSYKMNWLKYLAYDEAGKVIRFEAPKGNTYTHALFVEHTLTGGMTYRSAVMVNGEAKVRELVERKNLKPNTNAYYAVLFTDLSE